MISVRALPLSTLFLLLLALGGCATQQPRNSAAELSDPPSASVSTASEVATIEPAGGAAAANDAAGDAVVPHEVEATDAALPPAQQPAPSPDSLDPWQPFNRR